MKTIEAFMNYGYGGHAADWALLAVVVWVSVCMLLKSDDKQR